MTLAIRHELGHVLGLDHDDFEDSLMYSGELNANQQYRLTDYDRSLIRARYSE
jgi:predicted Zn-dependent protease